MVIGEYDRCEIVFSVFFPIMKEKCARKRVSLWNRFSFFLIRNGSGSARKNCKRSRSRCFRITRAAYLVCLSQKKHLGLGNLKESGLDRHFW